MLLGVGAGVASLAAGIHVYIWILESIRWGTEGTQRTFGVRTREEGEVLRTMAYNQGFYNLFLAFGAGAGVSLALSGLVEAGLAIALYACASMVLASLVLLLSRPGMLRAVLAQGLAPLVAIVLLSISFAEYISAPAS
ncbi:DUF1304 domain-containing protein [Homoserinibacter sp. GY 40078]|nr:DUF1304 domain-containing protein [Homoserinibacter sp. GY 40078]